jgi:hypothetical protein
MTKREVAERILDEIARLYSTLRAAAQHSSD